MNVKLNSFGVVEFLMVGEVTFDLLLQHNLFSLNYFFECLFGLLNGGCVVGS